MKFSRFIYIFVYIFSKIIILLSVPLLVSVCPSNHVSCALSVCQLHSPAETPRNTFVPNPTIYLISELLIIASPNTSKKLLFPDSFKTPCNGQRGDPALLEEVNTGGGL